MSDHFLQTFPPCDNPPDDIESCIHHNTSSLKKRREWFITESDIKELPSYYPLDRTYKVLKCISAHDLSERLTKCMKVHNLAMYWDSAHPTRLCCSTNNLLRFEINIWKKEAVEKIGEGLDDMIVEIRRHDGDCVIFHRLRRELFNFLYHEQIEEDARMQDKNDIKSIDPSNSNVSELVHFPHVRPLAIDNLMDVLNSAASSFELIFNQNSMDTIMGLQVLIFLTDAKSIHRVYAGHVSDFILIGRDVLGNSVPAARNVIYDYIVNTRNCNEHHYALQILANSFQNSTIQPEEILSNDVQPAIVTWNSAIPALILDVENAEYNPHVAYNAAKCIRLWYSLAGSQADMSYREEILSALEKVSSFGEQCYVSLATESNTLKQKLSY